MQIEDVDQAVSTPISKIQEELSIYKKQRELILSKTDSRFHMCGVKVDITNFQADHVQSHSSGGTHNENNYLPSCFTCNNYRWHYSSEEIQIILKLGVSLKTKITSDAEAGKELANQFVKHEMSVRKRRKAKQKKKVSCFKIEIGVYKNPRGWLVPKLGGNDFLIRFYKANFIFQAVLQTLYWLENFFLQNYFRQTDQHVSDSHP